MGCSGSDDESTDEAQDSALLDTSPEPLPGFPSSFEAGKFKVSSMVLLPEDQGLDFDDDGEVDNNLPNALIPFDILVSGIDMDRDGLNSTIASAIADNLLNILFNCEHEDLILKIDILGGTTANGFLQVDPVTLDTNGEPQSTVGGHFESERKFTGGPNNVSIPITFFESAGPVLAQVTRARMWGNLDENSLDGYLAGVVPVRALIDDVIEPTIPEDGFDTDGDGVSDISKATIMETVEELANNENIADIELSDDERGVSATFQFVAFQTDFPTPWQ